MKARIYIYAIVLAAGILTALADEPKTNTPSGATTGIPANTNEVAVPTTTTTATTAPAPAIVHKVKPPAVVPLTQTSAVPAQTNITTASPMLTKAAKPSESSGTSLKGALAIGVAFLAGGLVVFMLRRAR